MMHDVGRLLERRRGLFFVLALGVLCLFSFYSVQHTQTLSRPSAPLLHPSPTKKSALKEKEELVIVTGASDNHFEVLRNLLQTIITFQPSAGIIINDLGLPIESSKELADWCLDQQAKGLWLCTVRLFEFWKYPSYFNISIARGEYAWKPVIIKEVVDEYPLVLWLDAGDALHASLNETITNIRERGFISTETAPSVKQWTHEGMFTYFEKHFLLTDKILQKVLAGQNCNGAVNGWYRHSAVAYQMLSKWEQCALTRECIAPEGSSRLNHRQDQAALTLLALMNDFKCNSNVPVSLHNDGQFFLRKNNNVQS